MATYYLDTNIFLNVIYNEPHYTTGSKRLLDAIQHGGLAGITSSVTETEIALDLSKTGNRDKVDQALTLIERMENLTICSLNPLTARLAIRFVLDLGMTIHDAYHSATAVENKASLFVTRDNSLAGKLAKTIRVAQPEAVVPK